MPSALARDIPEKAPLKSRPVIWWLGIAPPCTSWDEAAAIFERKHGHPPREEIRTDGALLVGPIDANPDAA